MRVAGSGWERAAAASASSPTSTWGLFATSTASAGWCPICSARLLPSATPSSRGARAACRSRRPAPGHLYLPYATALRLSDLGYTNSAQAGLKISHDSLPAYVSSLRRAINTHDPDFARIGVKVNGEYRQLNDNVLQLENELYAPIRPKRTPAAARSPRMRWSSAASNTSSCARWTSILSPRSVSRWIRSASSISSWSGACCARPRALG